MSTSMDPKFIIEMVFGGSVLVGFVIWSIFRSSWLWTVLVLISAALCTMSMPFGALAFFWHMPMIAVGLVAGGTAGAIVRQALNGPPFVGPASNEIWHGPVAGLIASLTVGPAVLVAYEWFGGIEPGRLLSAIFSMREAPPFGLPAIASRLLLGVIWGFVCQLLFGRLQGPIRWIAWSVGYCLLTAAFTEVLRAWQTWPEPRYEIPMYAAYRRLVIGSAYGLGLMGLLAAISSWPARRSRTS